MGTSVVVDVVVVVNECAGGRVIRTLCEEVDVVVGVVVREVVVGGVVVAVVVDITAGALREMAVRRLGLPLVRKSYSTTKVSGTYPTNP